MSKVPILDLPLATAIDGSETLAGVQTGTTKGIRAGLLMQASASASTQTANTVFAGPSTGAAAAPTFRALVAADFGAATWAVTQGGTGLTSGTSGGILGFTASTTLASSVALTASALVLGGGAGATPTPMASLGTTTTVLHGNAAGAPTFGAVSLTADVSGTLPVANGGTNVTSLGTISRVDDTNVTLTLGGTPTNSTIQSVSFTMGWTGTLAAARGGTGVGSLGTISRTDDTNVTLTLGGTPTNSTIQSVSFTMGWSGQLALTRGGTAASLVASDGGIVYSTASAMAILSGTATAGQILRSGLSTAPTWSTSTFPATSAAGTVLASLTANTITATAAPVLGIPGTTMGTQAYSGSTSGTVTLTPQATAGSPTLTFPNATGTFAVSASAPITLSATTGDIGVTAAALTRTDDTNVTLTLGGTPTTALLAATSLTMGWSGQLGLTRGGTAASLTASDGGLVYSTASALAILSGTATAGQIPRSGSSTAPAWSTSVYPATSAAGTILASLTANTITASAAPVIGAAGTATGQIGLSGTTSGTITIKPSDAAGTYNFNLPATVGTAGQVLTSQAGGASAMTWTTLGAGTGDVVGPASSTDNAIVRFDSTTGKLVQNSAAFVDDSANVVSTVNVVAGYTTTATAAGTTTLTVASTQYQFFTGSTTQTVVLPVTSTLYTGLKYTVVNNSTGAVTVQSSGANNILVMGPQSTASFVCILTSGTSAASWNAIPTYANIPQNSQSAAYTTVLSDAGKHLLHPTADNNARTFTIDSNANVPYPVGTAITFINQINTVTIAITTDTLTLAGAGTTGSRTLAANGIATAIKVTTTLWFISGTGLS